MRKVFTFDVGHRVRHAKAVIALVFINLGSWLVAGSLLGGTVDLVTGDELLLRGFLVGGSGVAVGYGFVCGGLSAERRRIFWISRLLFVLMIFSLGLILRFSLVSLKIDPALRVAPWTTEVMVGILGLALATLCLFGYSSPVMKRYLGRKRKWAN